MVIAMLAFGTVLTAVVMWLWNWLLPELFGLTTITFWQALGILVLSKILFGGWMHKKGGKDHCHSPGSWKQLNPDEQQSMKQKFMQKWSQCRFEEEGPIKQSDTQTDNN